VSLSFLASLLRILTYLNIISCVLAFRVLATRAVTSRVVAFCVLAANAVQRQDLSPRG